MPKPSAKQNVQKRHPKMVVAKKASPSKSNLKPIMPLKKNGAINKKPAPLKKSPANSKAKSKARR